MIIFKFVKVLENKNLLKTFISPLRDFIWVENKIQMQGLIPAGEGH
jgi:hypothetical protein